MVAHNSPLERCLAVRIYGSLLEFILPRLCIEKNVPGSVQGNREGCLRRVRSNIEKNGPEVVGIWRKIS